jgi:hypothetical protein
MGYPDITEEFQVDLSNPVTNTTFKPNKIAYDVSINNLGFIVDVNAQTPYKRETAQYKKDQFDAAPDPGEQTLVASWWLRSQTSWHFGAGVKYFDPGLDYPHQQNRFWNSRGIDVWTKGDLKLHKDIAYVYSDSANHNFVACSGSYYSSATKYECMILGDSGGSLKRFRLNGNSTVTTSPYLINYSLVGHTSTTYPFSSVCTDGNTYYAACSTCVHTGSVDGTTQADRVLVRHGASATTPPVISYAKGYIFLGDGRSLWNLNPKYVASPSTISHSGSTQLSTSGSGTGQSAYGVTTHINPNWTWNAVAAGRTAIWAAGYGDGVSEIWGIQIDDGSTGTSFGTATNLPGMANATVIATLPFGEQVQCMEYYFGNLIVGTNKGVRICKISANMVSMKEFITVGPLLWDYNGYGVNGLTVNDKYVYAATAVTGESVTHRGCLVRIDLSQEFEDGTYAYAYDLEDSADENSIFTNALFIDGRRVVITEEAGTSGEIKVEHTTNYVSSGYLETGYIRYATIEPKYFKNIMVNTLYSSDSSMMVTTIDKDGNQYDILRAYADSGNEQLATSQPTGKQEMLRYRFTLYPSSDSLHTPIVQSYQVKAIPATPRQRIIQYPLSCYDFEMDRYNIQFGHSNRAYEIQQALEALEEAGDTVTVIDWRTKEQFTGLIETISFNNQSSPDKRLNSYGGTILLTVRKL